MTGNAVALSDDQPTFSCIKEGGKAEREDAASTLAALPLFEGLPASDLDELSRLVGRRRARKGQILFLEGDAGDKAYVVCSGTVDLVLGSAEGDQITLGQVGPGGFLGEMALLDDEPRSATAIVSRAADLLTISRQDLFAHLYSHPETMLNLIRALSRRLRAADDRIRTTRFLDVGGRLAKTLLSLDQPPGCRVPIAIQQEQLASMVGSTRQTVSEILGRWRLEGVVETSRGRVMVTNRAALEAQTETK